MSQRGESDLTVLVDIISNAAGMLILFACLSLLIHSQQRQAPAAQTAKPINFPLSYLPAKKTSVSLALRYGQLYRLPATELLEQVSAKSARGQAVEWLDLEKNGVRARLELTTPALGFRFYYKLLPTGAVPTTSPGAVKAALDQLVKDFPPEHYFVMIHVWPDDFAAFRTIREYLHEKQMEVGWHPRPELRASGPLRDWDIALAIGEYSEGFTSIKAQ